jgi:L-ascorbate metabolism protein UlaG (beta-lactamase superfamily)
MQIAKLWRAGSIGAVFVYTLTLCSTAVTAADALEGDHVPTADLSQGGGFRGGDIVVHPVNHASLVMSWSNRVFYVDPVGGARRYADLPDPDLILITDVHGDHLDIETLQAIVTEDTLLIAPEAVADMLPSELRDRTKVLRSEGQAYALLGVGVKTVPMYNTTEDRKQYHPKGRGNGYIMTFGPARVYIAGDTECTPEMRSLSDIDAAFVPMNLPYTMSPEEAAACVLEFHPGIVYPYHYRGSDVEEFRSAVESKSDDIDVRLLEWYD